MARLLGLLALAGLWAVPSAAATPGEDLKVTIDITGAADEVSPGEQLSYEVVIARPRLERRGSHQPIDLTVELSAPHGSTITVAGGGAVHARASSWLLRLEVDREATVETLVQAGPDFGGANRYIVRACAYTADPTPLACSTDRTQVAGAARMYGDAGGQSPWFVGVGLGALGGLAGAAALNRRRGTRAVASGARLGAPG